MKSIGETAGSDSYLKAKQMLPDELWPVLDEFINHYKFAALKHHGHIYSPRVLAELIVMGWRPNGK